MPIASQMRGTAALREVWINDWQGCDLLKPSIIKPVFATLEQNLIRRRLGSFTSKINLLSAKPSLQSWANHHSMLHFA